MYTRRFYIESHSLHAISFLVIVMFNTGSQYLISKVINSALIAINVIILVSLSLALLC